MPRKSKKPLSPELIIEKIRAAGLTYKNDIKTEKIKDDNELDSLNVRVEKLLSIAKQAKRNPGSMLFFIMYDIESDKVRRLVAKYLIRQGCYRIQRSIFLADLPHEKCEKIKTDLTEVQAAYDNQDSILVVPISTDLIRAMKVIGLNIEIDVIMRNQSTLFF